MHTPDDDLVQLLGVASGWHDRVIMDYVADMLNETPLTLKPFTRRFVCPNELYISERITQGHRRSYFQRKSLNFELQPNSRYQYVPKLNDEVLIKTETDDPWQEGFIVVKVDPKFHHVMVSPISGRYGCSDSWLSWRMIKENFRPPIQSDSESSSDQAFDSDSDSTVDGTDSILEEEDDQLSEHSHSQNSSSSPSQLSSSSKQPTPPPTNPNDDEDDQTTSDPSQLESDEEFDNDKTTSTDDTSTSVSDTELISTSSLSSRIVQGVRNVAKILWQDSTQQEGSDNLNQEEEFFNQPRELTSDLYKMPDVVPVGKTTRSGKVYSMPSSSSQITPSSSRPLAQSFIPKYVAKLPDSSVGV